MRSGSRHRGEAGGGWFGFPPLLATDGRIHKGDWDMRTGAIFGRRARGSCAALKWAALLGGFLVLGSVQAVAQDIPGIEDASFTSTQEYRVDVTMTQRVFGDGAAELLPGDFKIVNGGATPGDDAAAYRIDGLAGSRLSAGDSFTLVFDEKVFRKVRGLDQGWPLYYTAYADGADAAQARFIRNERGVAVAAIARDEAHEVRSSTQARELTLSLTDAQKMALQTPRLRGDFYQRYQTFATSKQKEAIRLPAAVGPPNAEDITYSLESSGSGLSLAFGTDVEAPVTGTTVELAFDPATRTISGRMPLAIFDYEVTYTATRATDPVEKASVTFTLKVAAPPDAPVISGVETASNSSIKVSWAKPNDNNDTITHYELGYRHVGQDNQVPTWDPKLPDHAGRHRQGNHYRTRSRGWTPATTRCGCVPSIHSSMSLPDTAVQVASYAGWSAIARWAGPGRGHKRRS